MTSSLARRLGRLAFYGNGISHDILPYALFEARRRALFARLSANLDGDGDLFGRVNHYCGLGRQVELDGGIAIRNLPLASSYYYYDLKLVAKHFGRGLRMRHLFGDITYVPPQPTIVKSRPIAGDNANSVLMKLDRFRHFTWPRDTRSFADKKASVVWRGDLNNPIRQALVDQFAADPRFDIGHTRVEVERGRKRFMQVSEQLGFRYIVSIEGYDVATNLKWIMASQSLCLMPRPTYETWFMEGLLVPGHHYVELRPDFADLAEKVEHFERHPEDAMRIIANANAHVAPFLDPARETLVSLLVLQKYFECTGQLPPEPFSHRFYPDGAVDRP